jgi:hypothetical protein
MARPEPTSGREMTKEHRIRQKAEGVRSEVFISSGVVTVTFRVLLLLVVSERYSHSKIVLQLIVVPLW